jgi:hypothetical protein
MVLRLEGAKEQERLDRLLIALWCNGSTEVSGTFNLGSNPGGAAKSGATVLDESGRMPYYGGNAHRGLTSRLITKLMV